jgi:hypothetical protein
MQTPSSNQTRYSSDASAGKNRRSARMTTPIKRSGMIQPSPDSQRTISRPLLSEKTNTSKKRKEPSSDSESQNTPIASKRKGIKNKKSTLTQSTPGNSEAPSSQVIDLAQDSDAENAKVKKKRQRLNPEFDDVKIFFSEPFCRKGDVSSNFNCLFVSSFLNVLWLILL